MSDLLTDLHTAYVTAYWHRSGSKIERLSSYQVTVVLPSGLEASLIIATELVVKPDWYSLYSLADREERVERSSRTYDAWPEATCEAAFPDLDPLGAQLASISVRDAFAQIVESLLALSRDEAGAYDELRRAGEWEAALEAQVARYFTVTPETVPEWLR